MDCKGRAIVVRSLQILGLEGERVRTLPIVYSEIRLPDGATGGGNRIQLGRAVRSQKEERRFQQTRIACSIF